MGKNKRTTTKKVRRGGKLRNNNMIFRESKIYDFIRKFKDIKKDTQKISSSYFDYYFKDKKEENAVYAVYFEKYKELENDEINAEEKREKEGIVENIENIENGGIVENIVDNITVGVKNEPTIITLNETNYEKILNDPKYLKKNRNEIIKMINAEKNNLLKILQDYNYFKNRLDNIYTDKFKFIENNPIKHSNKDASNLIILKESTKNDELIFDTLHIHDQILIKLLKYAEKTYTAIVSFQKYLQMRVDKINNIEFKKYPKDEKPIEYLTWKKRHSIVLIQLQIINIYEIHLRNKLKIIANLYDIFEKIKHQNPVEPEQHVYYPQNNDNENGVNTLAQPVKSQRQSIQKAPVNVPQNPTEIGIPGEQV